MLRTIALIAPAFVVTNIPVFAQDAPSVDSPFVFAFETWSGQENPRGGKVPGDRFYATPPSKVELTKVAEIAGHSGNESVQRLRGWIEAPETGSYRFAIASNDNSEFWLSTDEDPANLRLLANVDGHTPPRFFTAQKTQISRPITLIKGSRYYLEARHCQGEGNGHLSVGWKVPRSGLDEPYLIGETPKLAFKYELFRNAPDRDPASHPAFSRQPDHQSMRAWMTTPPSIGSRVGTRLSGIVVPPESGEYFFMISADDRAVLFVSPGGNPKDKIRVAQLDSWVAPDNWDSRPNQVSKPLSLKAGQPVYIELLHIQGAGPGHASVGWRGPNGLDERPIPSNRTPREP